MPEVVAPGAVMQYWSSYVGTPTTMAVTRRSCRCRSPPPLSRWSSLPLPAVVAAPPESTLFTDTGNSREGGGDVNGWTPDVRPPSRVHTPTCSGFSGKKQENTLSESVFLRIGRNLDKRRRMLFPPYIVYGGFRLRVSAFPRESGRRKYCYKFPVNEERVSKVSSTQKIKLVVVLPRC